MANLMDMIVCKYRSRRILMSGKTTFFAGSQEKLILELRGAFSQVKKNNDKSKNKLQLIIFVSSGF